MTVREALEKYKYEMIEIITESFDEVKLSNYWLEDDRLKSYFHCPVNPTLLQCNCSYNIIFDLKGE